VEASSVADLKSLGGDEHLGDVFETEHAELQLVLNACVDQHIHERLHTHTHTRTRLTALCPGLPR